MRRRWTINYRVGDLIEYGDGSPGLVAKVYWDGSVAILDPYELDEDVKEYHVIEPENIIHKVYTISPITQWMIDVLEKIMPLEMWSLLTLGIGVLIGIIGELIK